jgi:hypothetical protein
LNTEIMQERWLVPAPWHIRVAGLLVDARGERLTPSHAVKKGRRYRYYLSAALITDAGTDPAQAWRLAAREIEEAVIRILTDALTSPARLVERFGAPGLPGDQIRKLLNRATRMAAALGGSPGERAKLVLDLVEQIIIDEKTIIIKLRRGLLLGEDGGCKRKAPHFGAGLRVAGDVRRDVQAMNQHRTGTPPPIPHERLI